MNPNLSVKERVADLISRMTIEEKLLQLSQQKLRDFNVNNISIDGEREILPGIGSLIYFDSDAEVRNKIQRINVENTRLGIPVLFGFDVIHGLETVYPIPLAQSCSWNVALSQDLCKLAAYESYNSGINWTFSPMIDVSRDPRWGRIAECYGEDSYVNSVFGKAAVRGYQGDSLGKKYSIASCLKHFVGYGASEGGRDYRYTEISGQTLWDTYLPPYKACVEAGAATVMSAFNDISGIPATCNSYTLTEILKKKWGFEGFVVSDWNAVEQLVYQGVAEDKKTAGKKAFLAGVDMDMKDMVYYDSFKDLLDSGELDMSLIDKSLERILTLKFELGLFENPYTTSEIDNRLEEKSVSLCELMAEESYVLLKNDGVLPLKNNMRSIALLGPMAKDKENLLGSWSARGNVEDVINLYEGLKNEFGDSIKINYAKGSTFVSTSRQMLDEAVDVARNSDVAIICLGELKKWSGENGSKSSISLPAAQEELVMEISRLGKPIILVVSSGRPVELMRLEPLSDAILEIWQPGIAGGRPFAGIISGRLNPSGKLSVTFPLSTGQIPVYYNMRRSARPFYKMGDYKDIPTKPLYEFGHGLSYTKYSVSDINLSKKFFHRNDTIMAEVEVTNIGRVPGKETVLWYISDPVSSVSRPVKELKFFEKKEIKPNETKKFCFEIIPERDLSFVDSEGNMILESGVFCIKVYDKETVVTLEDR